MAQCLAVTVSAYLSPLPIGVRMSMEKVAEYNGHEIKVRTQAEFAWRDIAPQEWLCHTCFTLKGETQFRSFTLCKDC